MTTNWDIAKAKLGLKGDKGMCKCPAHQDSTASLSVKRTGDDVTLHCFAGCDWRDIKRALGLTFAPNTAGPRVASPVPHRRVVAEYRYRDYAGDVIAIKRRFEPKLFDWLTLRADGEFQPKFPEGMNQAHLPLYRLPEAVGAAHAGESILICEGEKDVDTLHALGLAAVCNPEGASGAASAYDLTRFVGLFPNTTEFCLIPDNDDAGRTHAARMAHALAPTFTVTVLTLPNLPEKGDVSDWVNARAHLGRDAIARELRYLVAHAMPYLPPDSDLIPANTDPDTLEAIAERAAVLAAATGWPDADCARLARHQVTARAAQERATLTPAQRLALECTDPVLAQIYREMASLGG